MSEAFADMIRTVPPGRWAVGVSGGADSVALLLLLCAREDVSLHVVHLDHQLRGDASAEDMRFVARLALRLNAACTVATREQIETQLQHPPANPSARYRAMRMWLFRQVVDREKLSGVLLAHHADDQAETILLRLLRGSGPDGLSGISRRRKINGVTVLRPLLGIERQELRDFLRRGQQDWREDASNQSDDYARNRVRKFLLQRPELRQPLLDLGVSCRDYMAWARSNAPQLPAEFAAKKLADLPRVLARQSARRWLLRQGAVPGELSAAVLDRLRLMAIDAATARRLDFPGKISVRRRQGKIRAADGAQSMP